MEEKLSNTFDTDLEDWILESVTGWEANGAKWGNSRMEVDLNAFGQVTDAYEVVVAKTFSETIYSTEFALSLTSRSSHIVRVVGGGESEASNMPRLH